MKKIIAKSFVLFCTLIVLSGCEKEPLDASLELTVLDQLGNKVDGASVYLYRSFSDLEANQNVIDNGTTNESGIVKFEALEGINYYWKIESICYDNSSGANTTDEPLELGKTSKVNVVLNKMGGTLIISNWDKDDSYSVYINGVYKGIVDEYSEVTYLVDAGTYNIEVKEIDYVFVQDKYNGNVTVTCGLSRTFEFAK